MNAESEQSLVVILLFVFFVLVFTFGFTIGRVAGLAAGAKSVKLEAVTKGVAEYTVDETGNPIFQWKESK